MVCIRSITIVVVHHTSITPHLTYHSHLLISCQKFPKVNCGEPFESLSFLIRSYEDLKHPYKMVAENAKWLDKRDGYDGRSFWLM